jgi:hypothetical protein
MSYHANEAATRHVRAVLHSYVRAQGRGYGRVLSLLEFLGMSPDEFAEWAATGRVSGRFLRNWVHGYELARAGDEIVLVDKDRDRDVIRVPREGWRKAMTERARQLMPGRADVLQAWVETQFPAW